MAAALFRRGTGLCCIHRELCRVVWRSQTALFSSKPSDRKQPRRTHIKKAKPQPAMDVAKLLEEIFSQRRPGTAPPTGKARPAKSSSTPTKPPTTSSINVSTSNVPPLSKTDARSLSSVTVPLTSASSPTSPTPAAIEHQPLAETIETKVETAPVAEASSLPAATVEPSIETTTDSPVEHLLPPVETVEDRSAVVECPVETTVEAPAEAIQTKDTAEEAPLIETTIDTTVEDSASTLETLESRAAVVNSGPVNLSHIAEGKPSIETSIDATVETSASLLETLESRAAVVEGSVETTIEAGADRAAQAVETNPSNTTKEETTIEAGAAQAVETSLSHTAEEQTTIEASIEASHFPLDTLETRAAVVEGPVEPTIDITVDAAAQEVETSNTDSGPVNLSHIAEGEPSIETTIDATVETSASLLETLESRAAVAEGSVETTIEAGADRAAQALETNPSHTTKVETTVEAPIEASHFPSDTLQTRAAVVEGPVESTIDITVDAAAQKVETNLSHTAEEETTIEASIEASHFPLDTLETRATLVEGPVEPTIEITVDAAAQEVETNNTDSGVANVSCSAKEDPSIETTIESAVSEGTVETASIQHEQESPPLPLENKSTPESTVASCSVNEEVSRSEEMTLESITLHVDRVLVASLKTDELLQTKSILDEKAEKQLQDLLVQMEIGAAAESEDSSEDESEILNEALSKWDSLSEDLQELEGESGALVKELLCHVPATLSKMPATVKTNGEQTEEKVSESMTLESVTLAELQAEIGGLETEFLLEARDALEKEADVQGKEEKMEVRTTMEDIAEFEEEILTLDSISEATDAIDAALLEIMLGSKQGPRQPLDDQGAEGESREQRGGALEAMSLESVTLAEVEASLGTLEDESLGETTNYLEEEAEMVAGETRMEVEEEVVVSEEMTEALEIESLPEDLQIDALMEELIVSVPGHITGATEGQEVVRADVLDETAAVESIDVDAAVVLRDDFPASPVKEVLLEEEHEEEEGAQAEALGNEDDKGTHADLDPVQRLFLEKIREYNNMRRLNKGLMEAEPGYEKYLSEETAKLQRLYGGGDLSSFPEFTFTEPKMDQDSK